jgi:hypothetical protein
MKEFRMALKHYAILNQFAVHKVVTNEKRYRAQCKANGCPWRIAANRLVGQSTVEVMFGNVMLGSFMLLGFYFGSN